jgi:hypothetical protein
MVTRWSRQSRSRNGPDHHRTMVSMQVTASPAICPLLPGASPRDRLARPRQTGRARMPTDGR